VHGEPECRDRHDDDLRRLDDLEHDRLVEAVGELTGDTGEQHVRQDEEPAGHIGQQLGIQLRIARGVIGRDDDQHVLVNVVVEGAERLRAEERQKAPLPQQPELRMLIRSLGHSRSVFRIVAAYSVTFSGLGRLCRRGAKNDHAGSIRRTTDPVGG
jgi:hypothetical protein